MSTLCVTNVVCTGKLPDHLRRLDFGVIIRGCRYYCTVRNEDINPLLVFTFRRESFQDLNAHRKPKSVCAILQSSGSLNIVGLRSFEEGLHYYTLIVAELERIMNEVKLVGDKDDGSKVHGLKR